MGKDSLERVWRAVAIVTRSVQRALKQEPEVPVGVMGQNFSWGYTGLLFICFTNSSPFTWLQASNPGWDTVGSCVRSLGLEFQVGSLSLSPLSQHA